MGLHLCRFRRSWRPPNDRLGSTQPRRQRHHQEGNARCIRLPADRVTYQGSSPERNSLFGADRQTPSTGIVLITEGAFQMVSTIESDKEPVRSVTASDYRLDTTEVTQKQYRDLMPAVYSGYSSPIEQGAGAQPPCRSAGMCRHGGLSSEDAGGRMIDCLARKAILPVDGYGL